MQTTAQRMRFDGAAVSQVLHRVLQDAQASGRLRRQTDSLVSGVVHELVAREWLDWDDERVVLTPVGRRGLNLLRAEVAGRQQAV